MISDKNRKILDHVRMGDALNVEDALEAAIEALVRVDSTNSLRAALTLMSIYDHTGCDAMDCGPHAENRGRLTAAISVIVFG